MPEVRIKEIDEHEVDTILAEDIDFEGHLTFKKPLMVKGKFKGEIKSSSSLYVGENAYVEARIEANLVSSKGNIKGDILGHARVELFSTSQLEGDVSTPDLVVESGCKFNGLCNMGGAEKRKEAPQQAAGPAQAHQPGPPASQGPGHAQQQAAPAQARPQGPPASLPGQGPAQQGGHGDRNMAPHPSQDKPAPGPGQQKPQTPPGGGRT